MSCRPRGELRVGTDIFDMGVMAGVKDGLARLKPTGPVHWPRTEGFTFDRQGQSVVVHSKITTRRLEQSGNIHYLISWFPQGM